MLPNLSDPMAAMAGAAGGAMAAASGPAGGAVGGPPKRIPEWLRQEMLKRQAAAAAAGAQRSPRA